MIQTDELRGIITKRNMSQASVAKAIGITPKTFYGKMKKGVFGSDEIDKMISLLKIQNPAEIFLRVSNSKRYRIVVKSERRGENINDFLFVCADFCFGALDYYDRERKKSGYGYLQRRCDLSICACVSRNSRLICLSAYTA